MTEQLRMPNSEYMPVFATSTTGEMLFSIKVNVTRRTVTRFSRNLSVNALIFPLELF